MYRIPFSILDFNWSARHRISPSDLSFRLREHFALFGNARGAWEAQHTHHHHHLGEGCTCVCTSLRCQAAGGWLRFSLALCIVLRSVSLPLPDLVLTLALVSSMRGSGPRRVIILSPHRVIGINSWCSRIFSANRRGPSSRPPSEGPSLARSSATLVAPYWAVPALLESSPAQPCERWVTHALWR